jgi:hypothetical protein
MAEKKTGVELIVEERQRQIENEKWTLQHDRDMHYEGELASAALTYCMTEDQRYNLKRNGKDVPETWPWDGKWWKPSPDDRIRELTKAGALIAAEIDRLQNFNHEQ